MIVYSIAFEFDRESEMQKAEGIVAEWISGRARTRIDALELWDEPSRELRGNLRLDQWKDLSGQPRIRALSLRSPDRRVAGRSWITEIGFSDDWSRSRGSMSLAIRVDDTSVLVEAGWNVKPPRLVSRLVQSCGFARNVPGTAPRPVADASAAEFLGHILSDPRRNYAVVAVSATDDGRFLVDAERLSSLVAGLAEVVILPADADTLALRDVLGHLFRSWPGAVRIVFPGAASLDRRMPPTRTLLPIEIEALRASGVAVENHLLSLVVDRTNAVHLRRHVSPDRVRHVILRRAIEHNRLQSVESAQRAAYASWLENEVIGLERKNAELIASGSQLEESVLELEMKLQREREEADRLRYHVRALKLALHAAPERDRAVPDLSAAREAARAVVKGTATPQQVLALVESLYSDRVVILDSARKAARDAAQFVDPRRMFERLSLLCDYYWRELVTGKGDTQARKVLGDWYAAHESEAVENSRSARRRRTFEYKGIPVEMMQHIKIGMKESAAETMRTYFKWDAEERKIIIGHCGRHLE